MWSRRHRVGLALLVMLGPLLVGPGGPEDDAHGGSAPGADRLTLPLFATANTDGELASSSCRNVSGIRDDQLHYSRLVERWRRLVAASRPQEHVLRPLALHVGDFAFPGSVGSFLLSRGVAGAERLAELVGAIPYAAVGLGNRELGLTPDERRHFAEGALGAGLPTQAANVVCTSTGGAESLCEAVGNGPDGRPWRVVDRRGLRIGVVSLVDPSVTADLHESRLIGLELLDPEAVLDRTLERMRENADPDLVVAQFHGSSSSDIGAAAELAQSAPTVDVMATNLPLGAAAPTQEGSPSGTLTVPGTGTPVVAAGLGPTAASVTSLTVAHQEDSLRIVDVESRRIDASSTPPERNSASAHRTVVQQLCRIWGRPIEGSPPLTNPMSRGDFVDFTLRAMRRAGRAEVAVANDGGFVGSDTFPIRERITYNDVHTTLPYRNSLVVASVGGETLRRVADKLGDEAVAAGLSVSGPDVFVNSRPIDEQRTYRVAMNRFVADGGDGIVDPASLRGARRHRPDWSDELPSIAEIVVRTLETRDFHAGWRAEDGLTSTAPSPDLHRRLLWSLVGSAHASFNQVAVANPTADGNPAYGESQLNVQPTTQISLEGQLRADADSRNHGWDNRLDLQYATSRTDSPADPLAETRDLIRARSAYQYVGFRADLGDVWWGPMPTAELQAESEFTPDTNRRTLQLTGILASTFELAPNFDLKIGADIRRDLSLTGRSFAYGLATAYRLDRIRPVTVFDSPVAFESELEYFDNITSRLGLRIQELRSSHRLYYSLFGQFDATATFSVFAVRRSDVGAFGTNTEATVGLNYRWDRAVQTH